MIFTIITPTTGNSKLSLLLNSINQLIKTDEIQIEHLIVIDGPKFNEKVQTILDQVQPINHTRYIITFHKGHS